MRGAKKREEKKPFPRARLKGLDSSYDCSSKSILCSLSYDLVSALGLAGTVYCICIVLYGIVTYMLPPTIIICIILYCNYNTETHDKP